MQLWLLRNWIFWSFFHSFRFWSAKVSFAIKTILTGERKKLGIREERSGSEGQIDSNVTAASAISITTWHPLVHCLQPVGGIQQERHFPENTLWEPGQILSLWQRLAIVFFMGVPNAVHVAAGLWQTYCIIPCLPVSCTNTWTSYFRECRKL